jgi:hypothetical protein
MTTNRGDAPAAFSGGGSANFPASRNFLDALNSSGRVESRHAGAGLEHVPHPVLARNSDLLARWTRWGRWIEDNMNRQRGLHDEVAKGRLSLNCLTLLNDRTRWLQDHARLLNQMLVLDPLWNKQAAAMPPWQATEQIETTSLTAAVSLLFWQHKGSVLELTPALEQMLVDSDLGDDVPLSLLQSPYAACYIRFGPVLQAAVRQGWQLGALQGYDIEGVYVFSAQAEYRDTPLFTGAHPGMLSMVPMFKPTTSAVSVTDETKPCRYGSSAVSLNREFDDKPMLEMIRTMCAEQKVEFGDHFEYLAQTVAKVFLTMSLAQTPQTIDPAYSTLFAQVQRRTSRKADKIARKLPTLYDRIVLGPQNVSSPQPLPGEHGGSEVAPHLRRGHFRMQAHGPQMSLRRLIFIAPCWIHPERLAA